MTKNNAGVFGIEYEEVSKIVNDSNTDWMRFIKDDSDGLTKTGQVLLQSPIESYVYSVLGAQAQTRWAIVGQGAKSLQTQQIFHRLVKDTILQDNPTKLISDMRTARHHFNSVEHDYPQRKVEGYNNVFTLWTKTMKFGVNTNVNYAAPIVSKPPVVPTTTAKPVVVPKASNNHLPYLLGSTIGIGFLVTKFVL